MAVAVVRWIVVGTFAGGCAIGVCAVDDGGAVVAGAASVFTGLGAVLAVGSAGGNATTFNGSPALSLRSLRRASTARQPPSIGVCAGSGDSIAGPLGRASANGSIASCAGVIRSGFFGDP